MVNTNVAGNYIIEKKNQLNGREDVSRCNCDRND